MKKVKPIIFVFCLLLLFSCKTKVFQISSIEGSRIEMDSTWDAKSSLEMLDLLNVYKNKLESEMGVELGVLQQNMEKGKPQSLLSNFTADAMKAYAEELWGNVDFAVMNNGGIRTTLNKGTITVGSIFEVYPFENELVLLELPGSAVTELFEYFALANGEGLSNGIKFVIKDKKIDTLLIGGKPVDNNKTYRVATIDYLAEGNSNMTAFLKRTNYIDSNMPLRDVMLETVRKKTAKGEKINSKLDDRITNLDKK